jgi:F-type H+-transporting ATPase subunit gamma
MARAQDITTQIRSLAELREIIVAIRAMAAVQMQQAQNSLAAVRNYIDLIHSALADASALLPEDQDEPPAPAVSQPAMVVFVAEHGFCGGFNEPLIKASADAVQAKSNLYVIFVGNRGAQRALEHGVQPNLALPMATHSRGVSAAARRVAAAIYRLFLAQNITSAEALHMRATNGREMSLQRVKLLPLEAMPATQRQNRMPPLVNMQPTRLRDELVAEYMFAKLEAITIESFASENAARFRTMVAAHGNIDRKSTELNQLARRMRQEAVTAEMLEIIGGAEAIKRVR